MSTVTGKAEIEARLTNLEGVLAGLRQVGKSVEDTAQKGAQVEGAFRSAGGALANIAKTGLAVAGVFQAIDFGKSADQYKQLDAITARFAQSSGLAATQLKSQFGAIEAKTLTSAPAMALMAKQLGRASYDGKAAAGSLEDLSDFAQATGQSLSDMGRTFLALHQGLGVTERFGDELGRIRSIADQIGTKGGHVALVDTFTALGPQIAQVNLETDQAKAKFEALVGVLGKGLKPEQAKAVVASTLSMLKEKAFDIERGTGKQVVDRRTGQLIDPTETLKNLYRLRNQQGGSEQVKEARRINTYGWDVGLALGRAGDFSEVDRIAKKGTKEAQIQRGTTAEEAKRFRDTEPAKREAHELELDAKKRSAVGGNLTAMSDFTHDKLGTTGMFAAQSAATLYGLFKGGSLVSTLLGGGAKSVTGAAGQGALATGAETASVEGVGGGLLSTISSGLGALVTSGLGVSSAAFTGAAALQLKTLSEIGEDRDTMGQKWRAEHSTVQAQELAQKAISAGDLTGVIGKAPDHDTMVNMLGVLETRFAELNETLRTQVAQGIAAELHRAPIIVRPPQDPNKPTASGAN